MPIDTDAALAAMLAVLEEERRRAACVCCMTLAGRLADAIKGAKDADSR